MPDIAGLPNVSDIESSKSLPLPAQQEPLDDNAPPLLLELKTKAARIRFWLFFLAFTVALAVASSTTLLYLSFATSYFQYNSLLSTIALLTSVLSAVAQPFWGKLVDASARSWCLVVALSFTTIGYTVSAVAPSVNALSAGQILYTIGSVGMAYLQSLVIADSTSLQSRGLAYGVVSMVNLPFVFIGPTIASGIGLTSWRWGYGMFCIILPVSIGPLCLVILRTDRRRRTRQPPRPANQASLWAQVCTIDPVGLPLVGTAFTLLFCPIMLYPTAANGWRNPSLIAMEIIGGLTLVVFGFWEWRFAPHPLLPRRILSINFALCLALSTAYFLAGSVYKTYWSSWVWVTRDFSESQWTYLCQTSAASLCIFTLFGGLIIRFTKRFKVLLVAGCATTIIGIGVCTYSATLPTTATLVISQILIQGGAAFALVSAQTALQGSVLPVDLAIAIAVYIFAQSMGGGVGGAIAGALWSGPLAKNLAVSVPSLNATEVAMIIGDITVARIAEPLAAIISSYNTTYRTAALAGLIASIFPFVAAIFVRNYKLDERRHAANEQGKQG